MAWAPAVSSRKAVGGKHLATRPVNFYFFVRDAVEEVVLKALQDGVPDPKMRFRPPLQDLMFFAAARPKSLGGATNIAKCLFDLGVPAASTDHMWQTPLFYAAREGDVECASYLIENGCSVNSADVNGQTPMFFAVKKGRNEMVELLTRHGASLHVRDKRGVTPDEWRQAIEAKNKSKEAAQKEAEELVQKEAGLPVEASNTEEPLPKRPCPPPTEASNTEEPLPKRPRPFRTKVLYSRASNSKTTEESTPEEALSMWAAGYPILQSIPEVPVPAPSVNAPAAAVVPVATVASAIATLPAAVVVPAVPTSVAPSYSTPLPITPRTRSAEKPKEVLAECGEYYVAYPQPTDVTRLRELEREFVADHAFMCREESWYEKQTPSDWCGLVNVIVDEVVALHAIRSIVMGQTAAHVTVQCVHGTGQQRKVVGYCHICQDRNALDVSHLKVDRSHQGKGLGALLMAGAARATVRESWQNVHRMRLVLLQRNERAFRLYSRLGFEDDIVLQKKVRGGKMVGWYRMTQPLNEPIEIFAEACERSVRIK